MLAKLRKAGKAVSALDDEPEIDEKINWYIEAYNRLHPSRNDFGIPISEIESYIGLFPIVGTKAEFVEVINLIDKLMMEKAKTKANNDG